MYDAVSCEGGVWERLAECVEAPVRQLVPLNKSWAALARDDQSALWRVLLRRLPGRRGVHAPCDGDVVRCGEARTWRDAFEGLETARYCWEAGGGPARRVFRITVAVRFRPTVRDAGGDDDAAAKVTMPLHQRLAAMRAGCEGAFDRRAALRKVLCEDQNRSPASDFGADVLAAFAEPRQLKAVNPFLAPPAVSGPYWFVVFGAAFQLWLASFNWTWCDVGWAVDPASPAHGAFSSLDTLCEWDAKTKTARRVDALSVGYKQATLDRLQKTGYYDEAKGNARTELYERRTAELKTGTK